MADEDFLQAKLDMETEALMISLEANAAVTAVRVEEFIDLSLMQGISPAEIREQLLTDLHQGGRLFGEFRNSVKATGRGSINRMRDAGQLAEHEIEQAFRWAAVMVNTCEDCLRRHNLPAMEWDEWVAIGLPRTGRTICKQNCKCMLIPDDESELAPIIRGKK